MKSIVPMLLIVLTGATADPAALDRGPEVPQPGSESIPLNWAVGVSGAPFASLGGFGEVILDRLWALQIQHFQYHEFVGFLSLNAPDPVNKYSVTSVQAGVYAKSAHFKAGVLSGAGMVDGVVRGHRKPGQESGCSEGCSYHALDGKRFVVPLKFVLGMNAAAIGISFTPQFYFQDGPAFVNALLNLEIGLL
jgi:hypothetical protein